MRTQWLAGVVLGLASGVAMADVGFSKDGMEVDIYGIVDIGIGTLEHSYPASDIFMSTINPYNLNSSPHSFTGVYTSGVSVSRVGLKGEADLGHDMKAFFRLETAFDANSGELSNNAQSVYNNINGLKNANGASAINGQAFSRAAYAGLSQKQFGSLEFGRTTNLSLDQVAQYDPVQAALLYSPLGFSGGIGGGLGATENTRLDNSVKYENRIGYIDFGLQYRFAGSKSDQGAESAYVGMIGYNDGRLSFKGTYGQTKNTVAYATQYSNVVAPDSNLQIEDTKGYMLTGMYKITPAATVKAGYEYSTISAPSDPNLTGIRDYYGITLPKNAVNATGEQHFGTAWIGGDYKFTKEFDLAVGYFNINTDNDPEVKKQYRAEAYSVLADYHFTESFDTYAGTMIMSYSGVGLAKKAPVLAYSSNALYGVGLRYRF